MRTLLRYLSQLPDTAYVSVHFGDTQDAGPHGLGSVKYVRLDKRPFPKSLTEDAQLRTLRNQTQDVDADVRVDCCALPDGAHRLHPGGRMGC